MDGSRDRYPHSHLVVAWGDEQAIRNKLFTYDYPPVSFSHEEAGNKAEDDAPSSAESDASQVEDDYTSRLHEELIRVVGEVQKIPLGKISVKRSLSSYGFDSISFTELTNALNRELKVSLMPTVFFEVQDLLALSQYLKRNHGEALASKFLSTDSVKLDNHVERANRSSPIEPEFAGAHPYSHPEPGSETSPEPGSDAISGRVSSFVAGSVVETKRRPFRLVRGKTSTADTVLTQNEEATEGGIPLHVGPSIPAPVQETTDFRLAPIAIIGMAGKFPEGGDLDRFWQIQHDV